jgi:hypothetical protein
VLAGPRVAVVVDDSVPQQQLRQPVRPASDPRGSPHGPEPDLGRSPAPHSGHRPA